MKRSRLAGLYLTTALLAAREPAQAQEDILKPFRADDGMPVMRAVPVRPPRTWPDDPVEGPAQEEVPVSTPLAVPRSTPRPTPAPDPVRRQRPGRATPAPAATPAKEGAAPVAKATPPPAPEMSDPGEIRIAPQTGFKSPDQAQLDIADSFYVRKMYENAAPEYQRYLELYPTAPERQAAYFRLGECYRLTGSINSARNAYETLLGQYQNGEFVGPAAYRLADIYYQAKDYAAALPHYRRSTVRVREPAVQNAAKFYAGRCMEILGQKLDARAAYEELAEIKTDNPFQDASRLSLANLFKEAGRTSDALRHIQLLVKQTQNPELKAEATVRTGLWLLDVEQPAKAAEELKKALEMPGIGHWKEIAQLGLIRVYYDTGKYKQVLDTFKDSGASFTNETKPELLLLVANSHRQLGNQGEALTTYDQIIKEFPTSLYAKDAGYERLVSLYNSGEEKLTAEIDSYLAANPETPKRDQVFLMKAEALFKKQDYKAAVPLYEQVSKSRQLTGQLRAEALFKLGWCAMQAQDLPRAIAAFTEFLDNYPTHKSVPYALVQRAIAYQNQKNLPAAERDFTEIIKRYPKAKERELALQQKALIRGQLNDNPGMAETFETLLRDYPQTPAAPQAYYWVGWAAFEAKDYKKAAQYLEKARELNKEEFFERASLRIMLARYYMEDRAAVAKEVDLYSKSGKGKVPAEVLRWLSEQHYEAKSYEDSEKYYALLAARDEVLPRDLLHLGESRLELKKYPEAVETLQSYLKTVQEPPSRALGLLKLAVAEIGMNDLDPAQKSVDEALKLQPEGKINGDARILAGDIQAARGAWDEAAKVYASVAVVIDDEEVTPRALEKAVEAYQKAGREPEAKKTLNTLQSRYPEYIQRKRAAGNNATP